MLPAARRVRRSEEFRRAIRDGVRVKRGECVVHLARLGGVPRVGFVVSRRVGNSVIRHRVTRRMRHAVRELVTELPDGYVLIVRALPGARDAAYASLSSTLSVAVSKACNRLSRKQEGAQ